MNASVFQAGAQTVMYSVPVRALCEFTAKEGDLDLRFTPSPSAQDGIAGHALVTGRRGDGYEREVKLTGSYGPLRVSGRADGYDPARRRLEEIKTYRGELAAMPANQRKLHWAQLRVYGHLLCLRDGLEKVELALVYFDIDRQQETALTETATSAELAHFFEEHCGRFLAWAENEMLHRVARNEALAALRFPHADFRPGQRQLAEAMFKASSRSCGLLAQAPTGIGKSVGSLFPMLKACAGQGVDKIFFLAAKIPGRALALEACTRIKESARADGGLPLRVLELAAKTSACVHPDKACHGDSCPLARGFYDRLPGARVAALEPELLDQAALRALGEEHQVCPYYLGAEMARWSDVVVGDYNYYFDSSAMLYGLTVTNGWSVNVLVDEAHNMVARARQMYSAELHPGELKMLRKTAPEVLKKPLDKVSRAWRALEKSADGADYQVLDAPPDKFMNALQLAASAIGDYLTEHPRLVDAELQRFYFDALQFAKLGEHFGDHSLFDLSAERDGARLCLRNIVPAPFLKSRFEAARCTALFSATLSPWNYYADMLGMPANTAWIDVESPFEATQLAVRIATDVSTRYQHRAASLAPMAALMARQYAEQPGNYLAFFSSFDYMEQAAELLAADHPDIPQWRQARRMDDEARADFLSRFTIESRGIAFAVLGGAFGEGIDLPGARLIGAFVATLGLAQVNPVNEEIRRRMDVLFGAGYDYAYLYPGLQKAVQAAGRVIRTQQDRGVVWLIDDRYARADVRALLPGWWDVQTARIRP